MRLGIMQPYFWPYLGYFQLISCVDKFVVYDDIEYTKKGWINRNRYLCNGRDKYFTIPLEKDSDYLDVRDRKVSIGFEREKVKNQIWTAYKKAPYFEKAYPLFCECIDYEERNLFIYIFFSIQKIMEYLDIDTELIISSSLRIDRNLKGQTKVLEICEKMNCSQYINAIGGQALYNKESFKERNIELRFIEMKDIVYKQNISEFLPALSILDVIMFNSQDRVKQLLNHYTLI